MKIIPLISLLLVYICPMACISFNKNYLKESTKDKEDTIDPTAILVALLKSKEMKETAHYISSDEPLQEI